MSLSPVAPSPDSSADVAQLAATLSPRVVDVVIALACEYSPLSTRQLIDEHQLSSYVDVTTLLNALQLQGLAARSVAPPTGSTGSPLALWQATPLTRRLGDHLLESPDHTGTPTPPAPERTTAASRRSARSTTAAPISLQELHTIVPPRRSLASASELRDRAILLIAFSAALTRREAATLQFDRIDITKSRILLTVAGAGSRPARTVPILRSPQPARCPVTALLDWRRTGGRSGPVWRRITAATVTHEQASEANLGHMFRRRLAASDHPRAGAIDFRSLREGLCEHAVREGWSREELGTILGHNSGLLDAFRPLRVDLDAAHFQRRIA